MTKQQIIKGYLINIDQLAGQTDQETMTKIRMYTNLIALTLITPRQIKRKANYKLSK